MGARTCVVVAIVTAVSLAHADSSPPIEEAIKQAAAAKKPLLLEFHAEWCGPCKEFEAKTLPEPRVQAALENVVFVRYDAEKKPGLTAASKYNVNSFPTFLVIDKQGIERVRHQGAPLGERGIKKFIQLIDTAFYEAFDEAEMRATIKAKPENFAIRLVAAKWFAARKLMKDAIAEYEAISTDKRATAEQRFQATRELVTLRRRNQWAAQLVAEKLSLIRANPTDASESDLVLATVGSELPLADVRALMKSVLDASVDNPDRTNSLVYVALAAGATDEALAAALRLVDRRRDPRYLDTLAECYHVRGDRTQATTLATEAIGWAGYTDLEPVLRANLKRFEAGGEFAREIRQRKLRGEEVWKTLREIDRVPERVVDPLDVEDRERKQATAFEQYMAEHKLATSIAKACKADAGDAQEALARIELAPDGKITSSVLLLEPTATAALRACLNKELAGATLGREPIRPKSRLSIHFKHDH